jgi:UDP-3-O-[3-hydroxymyristoyl] glucosamine N-acyltransferase
VSGARLTLRELAELLKAELSGDGELTVSGVSTLGEAGPEDISFLANKKYRPALDSTKAGAVIVSPEDRVEGKNLLVSKNPYLAFARAVKLFHPASHPGGGVSGEAFIGKGVTLGEGVNVMAGAHIEEGAVVGPRTVIYPGAYLGKEAKTGSDCILYPNVTVRERCILGDRVILQPGVVIGADGFGYATGPEGHEKIPQIGIVRLMDDVEVGAGSTIDRAALGETRIGRGTKIDNLVMVAHNVTIGEHCFIVSQTGISGSTKIGNYVVMAGQTGVAGHLEIGDKVIASGRAGLTNSVETGVHIAGMPPQPHREWLRTMGAFKKLPEMYKNLKDLEKRLKCLEEDLQCVKPPEDL